MRHLFTFLASVLITVSVWAQTPQKMSYQAVIRNSSDALVTNTQVGMQISILKGAADGTAVYTETQTPTTNANGLVSIEIGDEAGFSIIDWTNDIYFIKTETDPEGGTNYTITGVSQLLSVPYALHAKTAETVTGALDETDPLFSQSTAKGITAADTARWNKASGSPAEIDPVFAAWDKSTGIQISTSQVSGLENYIDEESDPVFKNSFAAWIKESDIAKLQNLSGKNSGDETNASIKAKLGITTLSGVNTGDQDLSGLATKTALENSTAQLRSEIPDVSAFLTEETDPLFTGWDKDYADLTNTPTTITTAQADAIVANTAKNSYPETDATKLAGIEDGAQVNVQADWDATTGDALILNKPDIPEAADGSETKVTAGTNVSVTGAGTADSPYEISATGATGLPTGTAPGQMQYWDGTKWVTVAAGNEGQVLTFTGGVPTWTTTAGFRDVQNPVTGAIWMDRNLGSTRVATSRDDENSYGDLYQWGRGADWHQIRTSGTTSALSGSATPGHSDFIMSQSDPVDWLITQNNNLWQGLDGINNPCPDGYRLPTRAEWEAEKATWSVVGASGGINSHLKLPAAGARSVSGDLINKGNSGDYWSSTVSGTKSFYLTFWGESTTGVITEYRAVGMSVRCIKD